MKPLNDYSAYHNKTYHISSLGCSKNEVDAQRLEAFFEEAGMKASSEEEAWLILVNTCGFIQEAVEESLEEILRLSDYRHQKAEKLVVMGCLPQRYGKDLTKELPEVDLFIGTGYLEEFFDILEGDERLVADKLDSSQRGLILPKTPKRSYAYLKIAEGCDNHCSYCLIPSLRGPYRSRSMEELVSEAKALVKRGVKELILIAQDVSRYGLDLGKSHLVELLMQLNEIEGLAWIRLQYLYPDILDRDFLSALSRVPKLLPYFDIPIQHASDPILKRMNRHTDQASLRRVVGLIREIFPGAALRTTVIVGFPGETAEQFEELLNFVKDIQFDRLGAFIYSDEEGSASSKLQEKVPAAFAQQRLDQLMQLQASISEVLQAAWVGSQLTVIIDEVATDHVIARSYRDAPEVDGLVVLRSSKRHRVGEILKVNIQASDIYDLEGVIDESTN